MSSRIDRRSFVRRVGGSVAGTAFGASLAGFGNVSFLGRLRPVAAQETKLDTNIVSLRPEIEPLVRLLENTPRDKLLDAVAARIRKGVTYREVLAALLLAGVRNVEPRPAVGFKFHSVLVVNSAHLASLNSPDAQRWLPIFWAIDYFKATQAQDVREGNWTMAPVNEKRVPSAHGAIDEFRKAMDTWDAAAADATAAGITRHLGSNQVFEEFFLYGARDYRSIGHKAIFVANSMRTLACIGWQHAEPVIRSLAYALVNHTGQENPAKNDYVNDRPWRKNVELVNQLCLECQDGKPDPNAAREMLRVARDGTWEQASEKVIELRKRDVTPQSIWDGLFEASAELVTRQPGIISLHSATTLNALHFLYQSSGVPRTRALMLLQAASFLPLFRESAKGRGTLANSNIETLKPEATEGQGAAALEEIFSDLGSDGPKASRKVLHYLENGGNATELIDAARLLVFLKGNDAHDYKYSSAVLEDFYALSEPSRPRFLAGAVRLLQNSRSRDNGLVERTREALR